jgi:hypothetical protein
LLPSTDFPRERGLIRQVTVKRADSRKWLCGLRTCRFEKCSVRIVASLKNAGLRD